MGQVDGKLPSLHRAMVMSRLIEEFCMSQSAHWYASVGEEATIVGTFSGLTDGDFAAPHYRGSLIVPWLRGAPIEQVVASVIQRTVSPTRGRLPGAFGGDISRQVFPYITMVLGPNLAVATGAALSFKLRGQPNVAVASFGDGTAGTGDFHETLNSASVLKVPVVFVCQNNQYSISTSYREMLACESIADWAARYGMPAASVDGNDVGAVSAAVAEGVDRARHGEGPSFMEALTYRRTGHFRADPAAYRPVGEAEAWEERDPIAAVERVLLDSGDTSASALEETWAECRAQIAAAVARVERSPLLTSADLGLEEVYERVD
jgi:TPP-dependent pyruvate/acetoin dehydrogenase alpha subunit